MNATSLHVPGHWECPHCGFQQIKSILAPGGVYTDTAPPLEPCPNDGRDMIPLTWQRACENQEKVLTQLLDQITERNEAIADLNQRLIDRTTGMLDVIQAQQLEIAKWKSAHSEVSRELLSAAAKTNDQDQP